MRTCYLHIGMPKTGTMSIQASLGQASSLGRAKYITIDKQANCSAAVLEIFTGEVPLRERELRSQWTQAQMDAERERLLGLLRAGFSGEHEAFILSGERLHNLSAAHLKQLHEELARHVDQVRVVAYVRSAASWIESAFQQRVKTGDSADFNNLRKVLPDYRAKFERFDAAFGRDKLLLWPFNPADFPGQDVVLDFCHRLDIPFDASQVIVDNEGVSVDGLGLLYLYRLRGKPEKMTLRDKQDIRLLARHLRGLEGEKMRFAPQVLKPYLAAMAADMAWMEGRFGGSVSAPPKERAGALTTEAELLAPTVQALAWLRKKIGDAALLPETPSEPQVVAAMEAWLAKLRAQNPAKRALANAKKGAGDKPPKPGHKARAQGSKKAAS